MTNPATPRASDERLLPCPFCGGGEIKVARDPIAYIDGVDTAGYCKKCGAIGASCKTLEEAVLAWNRRTKSPAPQPADDGEGELREAAARRLAKHIALKKARAEHHAADVVQIHANSEWPHWLATAREYIEVALASAPTQPAPVGNK